MFKKWFSGKEKGSDAAHQHQTQQEETPTFSLLIHFTPQMTYVYVSEDDFGIESGFTSITAEKYNNGGSKIEICGSYVIGNSIGSSQDIHAFVKRYQVTNPIFLYPPNGFNMEGDTNLV
jgi:hypothetical protein